MKKKIILIVVLYAIFFYLAGKKFATILFLLSGPAAAYIAIKVFLIEAPGNFFANLLYGEKIRKKPLKELSQIHILILQGDYYEALNQLNKIEEKLIEVEKLKMKILSENLNNKIDALKIGLDVLQSSKPSHELIEVLGNCVEIYIENQYFEEAHKLLQIYGPKMPSQLLVEAKNKRLMALQK